MQTLETLLQAYDNEDANAARAALNSPFIKHMDVEYAKLARGLPLPQQEYAVPPAGIRANAAESYVSPNVSKPAEAEVNMCLIAIFFIIIRTYYFITLSDYSLFHYYINDIDFLGKERRN